jgi:hypothetical protein
MSRFRFGGEEKRDKILGIKTSGLFDPHFGLGKKLSVGMAQVLFR